MEKLELKHLAPYLPYGLEIDLSPLDHMNLDSLLNNKVSYVDDYMNAYIKLKPSMDFAVSSHHSFSLSTCKPILRPLSDLIKEVEHDGERFVPRSKFYGNPTDVTINQMPYAVVQKILSWHFDIFGLIEKGLAIDINTIKKG